MGSRSAASAPGKLMLFGEYAVLAGFPALAMCVDRRIRCDVSTGGERLRVASPGVLDPPVDLPASALLDAGCPDPRLALLWPILRLHLRGGAELAIEAGFPATWGLGSSSASALAVGAALAGVSERRFFEARDAQRAVQGQASGYDAATQCLGGYVAFQDGDPPRMERIEPGSDLSWCVGWTGRKASTSRMIESVMGRLAPRTPVLRRIGDLAAAGISLLRRGDVAGLGDALCCGQALLCEIAAVPDDLVAAVRAVQRSPGVLGARLSGAGGGDCAVVLASERQQAEAALEAAGLQNLELHPERRGLEEEVPR